MNCPNITSMMVAINREDLTPVYKKVPHEIKGKGIVNCTKCNTTWCCSECAIESDALDHHFYDLISGHEGESPPVHYIICCQCSGKTQCWKDREDS